MEASLGVCVDPVRNSVISSKPEELRQITLACVHACECLHTCEGVQAHAVHSPMFRNPMLVRGQESKNGGRTESPESQPGKALAAAHAVSPASLRLSALFPRFITPSSFLHCSYFLTLLLLTLILLWRYAKDLGMLPPVLKVERAPEAFARKNQWQKQTVYQYRTLGSSLWKVIC